ncbi:MAG: alpha-galactosidase [Saccharofermentanales bacterium]
MNLTTSADMNLFETLLKPMIAKPENLPVSYKLGGVVYRGIPGDSSRSIRILDANMTGYVYTSKIGNQMTVTAECILYRDFAAIEWTVFFENTSDEKTLVFADNQVLADLLAIDTDFYGKSPLLYHCNGDFYKDDGYITTETALTDETIFRQVPEGGRPCDSAFPYQRLCFDGFGLNISIGWPGQWSCEYTGIKNGVNVKAGQQTVSTILKPGEIFRSPRISIVAFEGDMTRGINIWRRWYNAHIMPKAYGQTVKNYIQAARNNNGLEFTLADVKSQFDGIDDYVKNQIPASLWWIDAGWYDSFTPDGELDWYKTVGTWECDPKRFPDGFGAIGEKCRENGMDFVVWFEPERVCSSSNIANDHPEWLLYNSDDHSEPQYSIMLDLSNNDCVTWLSEKFAGFLIDNKITVYRQDFNFPPLSYWRHNEAENRQGMIENKYIQGYLRYWDYLIANVPNLVIDSCSSGGRRNDLETMRRAVPFHQTDSSYGNHPVKHSFYQTLYTWIPYFRGFLASWDLPGGEYATPGYYDEQSFKLDEYNLFSAFAPLMSLGDCLLDIKGDTETIEMIKQITDVYNDVAPTLTKGDFYALTPYHKSREKWTVWQFDEPEKDIGVMEVIRNNGAADESLTVYPKALNDTGNWIFINHRTGEKFSMSGKEASEKGITFRQPLRSISIWQYMKIRSDYL